MFTAQEANDEARDDQRGTAGKARLMGNRPQNERKFNQWHDLPGGGRIYWLDVPGRHGWRARYLKEVDRAEITTRFWQEIYDPTGQRVEIHHKFPVDEGHRKVESRDAD